VSDEIRALVKRHVPAYEVRSVSRLDAGLDNVAFEVNGELIVRLSQEDDLARRGAAISREAQLLALVAELSTLPVPEPVFTDVVAGAIAYRKLPGQPLLGISVQDPVRLAPQLGEFLSHLHQVALERVAALVERDDYPLAGWLREASSTYQEIARQLPTRSQRIIEDFLNDSTPPEPDAAVFCHNDLGAEHILVDDGARSITGVIDWSDAAIADPAHDLALIYRDLGPDAFDRLLAHYERPVADADRERAVFYARCRLLEDIAYGLHAGARRYLEAALDNLSHTFG
jgi:aminoglycoside phosphotransferase (APT) family kinase protein